MISFEQAYKLVLSSAIFLEEENVALQEAHGRILAEDIVADRDFPPFDRATKDGIVCNYEAIRNGETTLQVLGTIPAGSPTIQLRGEYSAYEIMTGAVVPENGDTVIMYEELHFEKDKVTLPENVIKGQNIHYKGSDLKKGDIIISAPKIITAAEIGVLATVGKSEVKVKKLPAVAVISTGNELVDITEQPKPYQIRKSNTYSLEAVLKDFKIEAEKLHLKDHKETIEQTVRHLLKKFDVLLISGGVSKGKYDYLPEVLTSCGVEKVFHKVLQRPGKPFWFGLHKDSATTVFSFPGNPVSTFVNYHVYFIPWLKKSFGLSTGTNTVILDDDIEAHPKLTRYIPVKISINNGQLMASKIVQNGSGDLASLTKTDAFIKLNPQPDAYKKGAKVPFISTAHLRF
jgi:molybdopterin molybdotransferase